ncbi:MAG: glycosyltransferase [Bacteroidetes bacterium]|nr:glycosyltransferase [Bacteroidota bacterium]
MTREIQTRYSVALIHDWLTGMRGGEKVLEVLCSLFPQAPILTLLHNKGAMSDIIEQRTIRTSFIDALPLKEKQYRYFLPLMPIAVEFMDFSPYDILISSSHAVAKNTRPRRGALHICYCHTPMRYIWDLYDDYFVKGKSTLLMRIGMDLIRPALQWWDVRTSNRVHYFIANSYFVAQRIQNIYNRTADVIHPPVDTSKFVVSTHDDGYYLLVSALVPYKRIDLAIEAFKRCGEKLIIVGSGPDEKRLKQLAPRNVEFLGWVNEELLAQCYARCRALIFPGVEDFGIVPLEAMASGKPVIAFGKGGVLESVVAEGEARTGIFFYEQTVDALLEALKRFSTLQFEPLLLRKHAEKFDIRVFEQKLAEYIEQRIHGWEKSRDHGER